jgi:hypothetical protein
VTVDLEPGAPEASAGKGSRFHTQGSAVPSGRPSGVAKREPRNPLDDDRDLIREGLRAVLRSEGTGSRAVAAKAQAARQLALLNGEPVLSTNGKKPVDPDEVDDPMADLHEIEEERRLRALSRGVRLDGTRDPMGSRSPKARAAQARLRAQRAHG